MIPPRTAPTVMRAIISACDIISPTAGRKVLGQGAWCRARSTNKPGDRPRPVAGSARVDSEFDQEELGQCADGRRSRSGQHPRPYDSSRDAPADGRHLAHAPHAHDRPGDGVGGRDWDAQGSREEQRDGPARFDAEPTDRLELGDLHAHRLDDAPPARERSEPHRPLAGQHHPEWDRGRMAGWSLVPAARTPALTSAMTMIPIVFCASFPPWPREYSEAERSCARRKCLSMTRCEKRPKNTMTSDIRTKPNQVSRSHGTAPTSPAATSGDVTICASTTGSAEDVVVGLVSVKLGGTKARSASEPVGSSRAPVISPRKSLAAATTVRSHAKPAGYLVEEPGWRVARLRERQRIAVEGERAREVAGRPTLHASAERAMGRLSRTLDPCSARLR